MTYAFPIDVNLSVVQVSATMSLHAEGAAPVSSEAYSFVLRASNDTNIVLSTGQRLADIDIHLTLSTKWRDAHALDRNLMSDDVGFLAHSEGERGEPFVHGAALLIDTTLVASLLHAGAHGKIKIVLPTVPFSDRADTPYVWGTNRRNMLRISHLEVSVLRYTA